MESVDGSAKAGEDFVKVDEIVSFAPGETEKQVLIEILDDTKWEPEEDFFLKLSLYEKSETNLVHLGKISVMEITIVDNDSE